MLRGTVLGWHAWLWKFRRTDRLKSDICVEKLGGLDSQGEATWLYTRSHMTIVPGNLPFRQNLGDWASPLFYSRIRDLSGPTTRWLWALYSSWYTPLSAFWRASLILSLRAFIRFSCLILIMISSSLIYLINSSCLFD